MARREAWDRSVFFINALVDTRFRLVRTRGDSIGAGALAAFLIVVVPLSFGYEIARIGLALFVGITAPFCMAWLLLRLTGGRKWPDVLLPLMAVSGVVLWVVSYGWIYPDGGYPQSLWSVFGQGMFAGSFIVRVALWNEEARRRRATRSPTLVSFLISGGVTLALPAGAFALYLSV